MNGEFDIEDEIASYNGMRLGKQKVSGFVFGQVSIGQTVADPFRFLEECNRYYRTSFPFIDVAGGRPLPEQLLNQLMKDYFRIVMHATVRFSYLFPIHVPGAPYCTATVDCITTRDIMGLMIHCGIAGSTAVPRRAAKFSDPH